MYESLLVVWFTVCGASAALPVANVDAPLDRMQERDRPATLVAGVEQRGRAGQPATNGRGVPALAQLARKSSLERGVTPDRSGSPMQPVDVGQQEGQGRSKPILLLAGYCVLIVLASLFGGWLPSLIKLTHDRMQLVISLVGGLMLGIGLFHMLPHAVAEMDSLELAVKWMMAGLLTMFFLIRTFHFHQHEPPEVAGASVAGTTDQAASPIMDGHHHDHQHDHDHDDRPGNIAKADEHRGHAAAHSHAHAHQHRLSWIGVMLGLSLHTLIDGLALAASVEADAGHGAVWSLFGIGTFVAICLHKPLDAVSITSLMTAGRWPAEWRNAVNAGFAMMCPLGVTLFYYGLAQFTHQQHVVVGCALAFSAGVFLCISLGDLLPEMEFHSHNRIRLSVALLIGIAAAYAIGFLEPGHSHFHGSAVQSQDDIGRDSAQDLPR